MMGALLGPRTLSWQAMAVLAPVGVGAALISDDRTSLQGRLMWVALGVVAQVALIIVVRIGLALGAGSRRTTTLAVVVVSAAARATVIALLAAPLGLSDPLPPGSRIIAATGTFTLWMIVIGAGAQAWFTYRQSLASMLTRVTNARAEASAFTLAWHDRLMTMDTSPDHIMDLAAELHDDIEQRLRPVSHRLWFGLTNSQARRHFLLAMLHQPVPIATISGCSLVLYVWIISYGFGATFALISGVVINIGFTGVLIVGRFMQTRRHQPSAILQLASVLAAMAMTAIVASFYFPRTDLTGMVGLAVANLAIVVSVQAVAVAIRQGRATLADLGGRVDQLDDEREQLAAHLHSTVQSRWTATALQLEHAATSGDASSADRALAAAQDLLEGDNSVPVPDSLSVIATRWEGIAAVTIGREDPVPPAVATTVTRLVEEAIANSVRHGRARNITVNVSATEVAATIDITDDGEGIGAESTPGLGSRWRDQVSVWSLASDETGTRLTATISLE